MDTRQAGLLVAALGAALIVIGALIASGLFGWFGRLPGDIRIAGDNVRIYAPFASMLVLSLVVSLVIAVVRRL
jgi:hypothetical protein